MLLKHLILLLLFTLVCSKYPILFIHGMEGSYKDCDKFAEHAKKKGFDVYGLDFNNDLESNKNLTLQVKELVKAIKKVKSMPRFSSGFHIVAHGYGALISRCAIEEMSGHGVRTFITLAGVNAGTHYSSALPNFFYGDVTDEEANEMMRSKKHHEVSGGANGWRDVDYFTYMRNNTFKPYCNNEVGVKFNPKFVTNFLQLKKFVMFASPAEERVRPWYTALMDYDGPNGERMSITRQPFWAFGMPFIPQAPLEILWEPVVAETMIEATALMTQMVAEYEITSATKGQGAAKETINKRIQTTIPCANPDYTGLGQMPSMGIPPCNPTLISYVHDAIIPIELPISTYYSSPFAQPPSTPIVIMPSHYYRGFGLYELSRKGSVYRYALDRVTYWEWLNTTSVFEQVLEQIEE